MNDIILSPEMETRIAAKEILQDGTLLTRTLAEQKTEMLIEHAQNNFSDESDLRGIYRNLMDEGADINGTIRHFDIIFHHVASGNVNGLKAVLSIGAQPRTKYASSWTRIADRPNAVALCKVMLEHGFGQLETKGIDRSERASNGRKALRVLYDWEGNKVFSSNAKPNDLNPDYSYEMLPGAAKTLDRFLIDMNQNAHRSVQRLLRAKDQDSPIISGKIKTNDLQLMYATRRHDQENIQQALSKDSTSFRTLINALDGDIMRKAYESTLLQRGARDYTAELARTTIEGPAEGWSVQNDKAIMR